MKFFSAWRDNYNSYSKRLIRTCIVSGPNLYQCKWRIQRYRRDFFIFSLNRIS